VSSISSTRYCDAADVSAEWCKKWPVIRRSNSRRFSDDFSLASVKSSIAVEDPSDIAGTRATQFFNRHCAANRIVVAID
jgi:hypothetical protein